MIASNALADAMLGAKLAGWPLALHLRHPQLLEATEATLATKTESTVDLPIISAQGRDNLFRATLKWLDAGQTVGVLVTFADQSESVAAHEIRREFVANVSHELRTPLTAILGFIETLAGPAREDAAARARFLGVMQAEAERMARLIDDLLSLSRVEDDERRRPRDRVDLCAIVKGALAILSVTAKQANVSFDLDLPETGATVIGDEEQLRQVVLNLVENAIKYGGKAGRVRIAIGAAPVNTDTDPRRLRLSVQDFGEGIAAHHIPRLTERFYRVDTHRSREIGGTGLGLAIVKHIIQRHRGLLKIDSVLGQGTVIAVDLLIA